MSEKHKLSDLIIAPALVAGLLLIIPLLGMQFSNEVNWTLFDFVIAGILTFGIGISYKLITRRAIKVSYKIAVGFALFVGLFLIWVNLGVGIIGSENNPYNMIYFGVIGVGTIGAIIGRFEPKKMVLTLFVLACTLALIAITALFKGIHQIPESSVSEVIGVNGLFITLFVVAAFLFRYADQDQMEPRIQ